MRTSKWAFVTIVFLALAGFTVVGVPEASATVFGTCTTGAPTKIINIGKFQPWFTPVQIIVNSGDCVQWPNNDPDTTHTVTSLGAAPFGSAIPTPGTAFGSGKLLPGDVFQNQFFGLSTNPYICLIHPWMAGNISVGVGVGPVPDILQGTDTQDMATPDRQGVIGIGEWCTTATYEAPHQGQFPGVVHCGSAHLWLDSSPSISGNSGKLETAAASGVTAAVQCNGTRQIGGRFEGATTTHNLWNNNHFTKNGDLIGPNGTATGNPTVSSNTGAPLPGGTSNIVQPNRDCFTFSTNLHGQTFQWIRRGGTQGIIGTTSTLPKSASDVTHVMTNPGGTVGWVTMEAGHDPALCTSSADRSVPCIQGYLGVFDPNAPPPMVTNFVPLGSNFPHGNWVCANGIYDTVPAPLSNTIGVVRIPATPTDAGGAGNVVNFFPSLGGTGVYPVATGTMPNCAKAYTSNAVDHRISVTNAMTAGPAGGVSVDLGTCTTCTLMGAPVPSVHIAIQITPMPDSSKVVVQVSKASLLAVIETVGDTVISQQDCGNGCHGSYMGPKLGGGFYLVASAAYQDKMSIMDMDTMTKVGDVKTNMSSLLGLQGTTPLGDPNIMTLSPAVGWNSGTIAWPQEPPWK